MKARYAAISLAAILAAVTLPIQAGSFGEDEVAAMAYVNLPFGGASREREAPMLGFALKRNTGDGFGQGLSLAGRPAAGGEMALVDVRFDTRKQNWDRFHVGGVDALTYEISLKADGTTAAEPAGISPAAIAVGVVVGAVILNEINDDDTNTPSCGVPGTPACGGF